MDRRERLNYLRKAADLSARDIDTIMHPNAAFSFDNANQMIENTIGILSLPLGIATGFVINGKESLIQMVIEEPSVIAAARKAAKMASQRGGFPATKTKGALVRGRVHLVSVPPPALGYTTANHIFTI